MKNRPSLATVFLYFLGLAACRPAAAVVTPTVVPPTPVPAATVTPTPAETVASSGLEVVPQSEADLGEGFGYAFALSPDGSALVVGSPTNASVVDSLTFEVRWSRPTVLPVQSVAWSPDGSKVGIGTGDIVTDGSSSTFGNGSGAISVLDGVTGDPVWDVSLGEAGAPVLGLAFSPDGSTLAAATMGIAAQLLDVSTGGSAGAPEYMGAGPLLSTTWSPDGSLLAGGYDSDATLIWNLESGQAVQELFGNRSIGGSVIHVAFSPDGTRLASAASTGPVIVWDVRSGEQLLSLSAAPPAGAEVNSVSTAIFSPDGTVIAVGFSDRVVLWDDSGNVLADLPVPSPARAVAFTPDGRTLFVGMLDGSILTWVVTEVPTD